MSSFRMTRRSFLILPAFASLVRSGFADSVPQKDDLHCFSYDHVIGTSLDLDVWTSSAAAAQRAERAVLDEVRRLVAILNTRDPDSEINRLNGRDLSPELSEVLALYEYWNDR